MAFDVGSIVAKVTADISGFQDSLKKAEKATDGLRGNIGKIGDSIADFGKKAAVITGAVATGIGALTVKAIGTAAEFERLETALTTVTGSAEKAEAAMATIKKAAKDSPFFETSSLAEFVQLMAASGQTIDDAVSSGLKFGDVAAAFGKGNAEMTRMGNTLSQVMGKGKADIVDFKELVNAGWVSVRRDVAASMEVTMAQFEDMVSAGEIGYDQISKAAEKYAGSAAAQSKNMGALWSRLKETIATGLADLLTESGGFDALKGFIDNLIWRIENIIPAITNLFINISKIIGDIMNRDFDIGAWMSDEDYAKIQPFIGLFQMLQKAIADLTDWVKNNQELVTTFLQGMAIGLGALLIIGTITGLLTALFNPITLVVLGIAALYTAWQTNFLGMRDIVTAFVTAFMQFFNNTLMPFILVFVEFFRANWWVIQSVVKLAWDYIIGIIKLAWAIISGIITVALELLAGDWSGAWEAIKKTASNSWAAIKGIFNGIISFLSTWGGWLFDKLTKPFSDAWGKIKETMDKIKDALDFTKRHSPSVLDIVNRGVAGVNKAMAGLDFGVSMAPSLAATAVTNNPLGTAVNNVVINLDGAMIGDIDSASQIAERIGDSLVKRLQMTVRF
jgi:tape measure domain-containing protein